MARHRNPTHAIATPLWGATVVLWALLCWSFGYGGEAPALQSVWSVDLRQWGYTVGHAAFLFRPPRHTVSLLGSHPIALSHGYVAFAFLTQEMGDKHVDVYQSLRQRLISLDAATGKLVATRTWPAAGADITSAYVAATKEGNLAVLRHDTTGQALCLYSPDLQEIRRIDLPADPAISTSGWSIFVPPDGSFVFVEHYLNGSHSLRMLERTTLRELRSWDNSEGIDLVSGPYLMQRQREIHKDSLYLRGLDTPWLSIAELGRCYNGSAEFINADTLAVSDCNSAELIRADGKVLFTAYVPKGRLAAHAWGSPDGRLVAVATTTTDGLRIAEHFDMSSGRAPRRILVYDTKTGSIVDSLKFTWLYAGAFSPDSSEFVLLSDGILRMFHLPSPAR